MAKKIEKKTKSKTDEELEAFKKAKISEVEEEAEEADIEESEESEEETEESEEEAETEDHSKDHEELLAEERRRREEAERLIAKNKADRKRGREHEDSEDEEDKPLTAREFRSMLAEDRQATQKEILSSQIKDKARALATSDTEANLIYEIHKNRTFPSYLSLDEQVEEAYAIANRKKLISQNEELRRALRSKETKRTDASATHRESPKAGEPKLPAHDRQAILSSGFVWDGKFFSKKLSNGKTLIKDWRTKKSRVI